MDISKEVNFIWNIADKLRGAYTSDKYKDVIIPMVILRRFECALADTKKEVLEKHNSEKNCPARVLERESGYKFLIYLRRIKAKGSFPTRNSFSLICFVLTFSSMRTQKLLMPFGFTNIALLDCRLI